MSSDDPIADAIEDAFLEALEQGANPPSEFWILLPRAVFDDLTADALHVAGYVIRLGPNDTTEDTADWIH